MKYMEIVGAIAIAVIVLVVILLVLFALPIAIISALFTPGRISFAIAFIIAKKAGWLKISWWWILLGLLIPF